MRLGLRRFVSALGMTAVVGLAAAPDADASLILAASAGGANICAVDNNAFACAFGVQVPDTDPTLGTLALGSTTTPILVGGLSVLGSVHTATFGPPNNLLDSSSLEVLNTTGAPVSAMVAVGSTDFVGPATQAFTTGSGTWVTANGSTINLSWYNDPANAQGADTPLDRPGVLVNSFADLAVGPLDSFSHSGGPFAVADPGLFSMTLGFDFTLVPGGSLLSRGQAELKPTAVPEPVSLALLAMGLGAAAVRRRKRM
jgi:hypothetical protein